MAPIHYACKCGNLQALQWLWIFHNQALTQLNQRKWSLLHYACWEGHESIAEFLLQHGIDPNSQAKYGETPLMFASFQGNLNIVRLLLSFNVDMQGQEKKPLVWAAKGGIKSWSFINC